MELPAAMQADQKGSSQYFDFPFSVSKLISRQDYDVQKSSYSPGQDKKPCCFIVPNGENLRTKEDSHWGKEPESTYSAR